MKPSESPASEPPTDAHSHSRHSGADSGEKASVDPPDGHQARPLASRRTRTREPPSSDSEWSRRGFVAGVSAIFAGGFAGCTGDDGDEDGDDGGGGGAETTTEAGTVQTTEVDDVADGPAFSEAVDLQDEFAFEVTAHYQDAQVTGRRYQGDHYHDVRVSGTRVEEYFVDGTSYVVTEGVCVTNPDPSSDPTSELNLQMVGTERFQTAVTGNANVQPVGTTTISGDEVYAYEVTVDDVQSVYYVTVDTNLLRRVEMNAPEGDVVVEFHSWGDVDPVEPPDCAPEAGDDKTTTDEEEEDGEDVDGPVFSEAVELVDEFAFEITAHYQDVQVSGRHYQDDHYHDIRVSGTRVEQYFVDGTLYVLTQGVCVTDPSPSADPASDVDLVVADPATHHAAVAGNPDVVPGGTTTIDGQQVYIYDVTVDGVESTYYVTTEDNLLRRVEMNAPEGDAVIEFHSWGAVSQIEPPAECTTN
jgi:hypothetical protein